MNPFFFFSSRRRHTRSYGDSSSDVCSSDLMNTTQPREGEFQPGDRVRVIDGTFISMEGVVATPPEPFTLKDALAMELTHPKMKEARPTPLPVGFVRIVLSIFGQDVPVDLGR